MGKIKDTLFLVPENGTCTVHVVHYFCSFENLSMVCTINIITLKVVPKKFNSPYHIH